MSHNGAMSTRTRFAIATGAASALGALAVAATRTGRDVGEQIGGVPDGARLARMRRSPNWWDGRFHNLDPVMGMVSSDAATSKEVAKRVLTDRDRREPQRPVPLRTEGLDLPDQGAHCSWLGHASVLVALGGERVLFDPVWSDRCSPSSHVGPRRMHPVPFALESLPPLAAVVISHDHYDHLDMATIQTLDRLQRCPFVVPLGIGAHLERWGVGAERIIELDWSESTTLGTLTLTAVASQHFSGRGVRRNPTLWASWVVRSPAGSVYFSGDTGYFDGFTALGAEHGPFDAAFMAVGMYDPAWRPMHLDPEEAVQAALELGARLAVPIHWCTFALAPHAWSDPPERFVAAAEEAGLAYVMPEVGEAVDVLTPRPSTGWWRP